MIRTWMADISPLYQEDCYRKYYEQAPDFRKAKADALRFQQMKAQSIGVWSLFERIKDEHKVDQDAVYNFSHSGDFVLCSIAFGTDAADVKVGCDIQEVKHADIKMAKRFFCPGEYADITEAADEKVRNERFFRLWVLKESFLKATRMGIRLGMDTFEILPGTPPVLIRQPEIFPDRFYYMELQIPGQNYKAAVCSTDAEIDSRIQMRMEL